jgi:hypothetical protein
MEEQLNAKQVKWYWPAVDDVRGAKAASDQGFWGAVVVAGFTALVATISLITRSSVGGIDALAYIDAIIFGVIAFGIRRRSRIAAVAGLSLFIVEKLFQLAQGEFNIFTTFMTGLLLVLFISGIRGNFAFHRLSASVARDNALDS